MPSYASCSVMLVNISKDLVLKKWILLFGHNILSLNVISHADRYDTGILQGDHGVKYCVKASTTFTLHGKISEQVIHIHIYIYICATEQLEILRNGF